MSSDMLVTLPVTLNRENLARAMEYRASVCVEMADRWAYALSGDPINQSDEFRYQMVQTNISAAKRYLDLADQLREGRIEYCPENFTQSHADVLRELRNVEAITTADIEEAHE